MIFSLKVNKPQHPPLTMQNQTILEVALHKHLGAFFSNDCPWHSHIDYVKEKAWARVNVMRKLKYQLDRKSLETIYLSFIIPLLEYADVIWDNCTAYEKLELDKIQNEAARIVSGAIKVVSTNALYLELGWERLETRRRKPKLVLFFKMVNELSPLYLSSLVPSLVGNTSRYNLRNANDMTTLDSRTSCYFNSFLPSVVREWNTLPLEMRIAGSLSNFKLLKRHLPPTIYYSFGTRNAQVLHCRLRTECSSLNEHLYLKYLEDSPLCRCGATESTHHFFFICPMYTNERAELLGKLSPICDVTLNIVLCGLPSQSYELNVSIFEAVHKFILDSKRF